MRIARFNITGEPVSCARTGVILAGDVVADLRAGYTKYLIEEARDVQGRELAALRMPADVTRILHVGGPARAAMEETAAWLAELYARTPEARGVDGEALFTPLSAARLHNPLKPGRLIVVRGNANGPAAAQPIVWNRAPACVMGPVRDLPLPQPLEALSYGTGLAIVIDKRCHGVSERDALRFVAGYMVANEIEEPAPRGGGTSGESDLAGDAGFRRCIIGPYLVDAGDIPHVQALRMATRVNGAVCQSGSVGDVQLRIRPLIARLSAHALEPGDVIVTALLSDTAAPGSGAVPWLRAGDVLESEIEGLGLMRNKVVAESARAKS